MFGFLGKKNKDAKAKTLPDDKPKFGGRRIINDIVPRKHELNSFPKIIISQKTAPEEAIVLPQKNVDETATPPSIKNFSSKSGQAKIFARPFIISLIVFLCVIGGVVILLSTVFSKFTLVISPKIEAMNIPEIMVLADTKLSRPNHAQNVIPGEIFELAGSREAEFNATGKQNIEDRASGVIKIYNSFSSSPQKLVATTRFSDESGKIFRLTKTITVPGAIIEDGKIKTSSIEAEVEASESGEGSNIKPSHFKIPGFLGTPKYDTFYGESEKNFSGGFRGIATVVSADDIKKASESVTAALFIELKDGITKNVPRGFHFVETLREIVIENVKTPPKGLRQDKFKVVAKGRARVIVFRDEDLSGLVKNALLSSRPGKEIIDGSLSFIFKKPEAKFDKGMAQFNLSGNAKIKSRVEGNEIMAFILGKKFGTIEEFLKKNNSISSFQFKSFPFWNLNAPHDSKKVNILIK